MVKSGKEGGAEIDQGRRGWDGRRIRRPDIDKFPVTVLGRSFVLMEIFLSGISPPLSSFPLSLSGSGEGHFPI